MMEPIEAYTHAGMNIQIHYDDARQDDCPLGYDDAVKFCTWQRDSTLSDRNEFQEPDDALAWAKENGWEAYNLFYYEHGLCAYMVGQSNPFHCPWDSGQVGLFLIDPKQAGVDPFKSAQTVCETVTDWCNGNIYGYIVESEDGDEDSCWGFYGFDYVKSEAESVADFMAARKKQKRVSRLKEMIRNRAPLEVRETA